MGFAQIGQSGFAEGDVEELERRARVWTMDEDVVTVWIEGREEDSRQTDAVRPAPPQLSKPLFEDIDRPIVTLFDRHTSPWLVTLGLHSTMRLVTADATISIADLPGAPMLPGAAWFLPRLREAALGTYLALTALPLRGADAVHAGLATHFVPDPLALQAAVTRLPPSASSADAGATISQFATPTDVLPPLSIAPMLPAVSYCFAADSAEDILRRVALVADGVVPTMDGAEHRAWAAEALAAMRSVPEAALQRAVAQLRAGADMTLADAMRMEDAVRADAAAAVGRRPAAATATSTAAASKTVATAAAATAAAAAATAAAGKASALGSISSSILSRVHARPG